MATTTVNDVTTPTKEDLAERGVYPGTVYARAEQVSRDGLKQLSRESFLAADRNKWFVVTVALCGVVGFLAYHYIQLSQTSSTHREVIWVKMYNNGTWDVEPHDNHASIEFLEATVNSLLKQWVARRFSEVPETVLADYTYANYFLSPELTREFTGVRGFHAAQKAAEIQECRECPGPALYRADAGPLRPRGRPICQRGGDLLPHAPVCHGIHGGSRWGRDTRRSTDCPSAVALNDAARDPGGGAREKWASVAGS